MIGQLFGQAVMAWTRTRLEVPEITGDLSIRLAAPPLDGGWTPRLGRAVTIGTVGPDRIATTGPLNEPTSPVSPQAARPAVSEREIGPGGVSGCSAMPESEKVQPARLSSRIQGGQDTVERDDGLSVVMEKEVPPCRPGPPNAPSVPGLDSCMGI